MPELPEMETYKYLLSRELIGRRINEVTVQREKSLNVSAAEFTELVRDRIVISISRRAKHLLFHLDSGDTLLLHLMLGGWMFFGTEAQKPDRTAQVAISFGDQHLYFIGLRLGYLHLLHEAELRDRLSSLGPEPLAPGMEEAQFVRLLKSKRGILKPTLVDQKVLAGIGNCYSDEFCFHAGILPFRRISDLSLEEMVRLFHGMQYILRDAMKLGGYMEDPLFVGDTLTGGYNDNCRVYDRGGEPCSRCGQALVQEELSSRKVFYCTQCQT
jgi:formamidopyrimidine-DNA glycosylase